MPWFSLMSRAPWWEPEDSENATTLTETPGILRLTPDQAAAARSAWALRPRIPGVDPGVPTNPNLPPPVTPFTPGLIPALLGGTL